MQAEHAKVIAAMNKQFDELKQANNTINKNAGEISEKMKTKEG